MLKKFLSTALIASVLLTAGCGGNETAEKAVEQSKLSMASGDYTAALNYLKLAMDEGNKDAKVRETAQILENFLKAKEEVANHQTTKALEYLNAIPESYKNSSIAADIEKLRQEIDKGTSSAANIEEQISAVRSWIASGDYASAALNIAELFTKNLSPEQRKQAEELRSMLEAGNRKVKNFSRRTSRKICTGYLHRPFRQ